MNLLLDTHVLIWWMRGSTKLGPRTKRLLDMTTRPVVSAASIWEIAIKTSAGRVDLAAPMEDWVPHLSHEWGIFALPVTFEHAMAVRDLPPHHGDPFDRLLIAQAQCENLTIVTVDSAIREYDVRTIDASA